MAVYGEERKTKVDLDELLHMMQHQQQSKRKVERPREVDKPKSGRFPITTLVLVALVIALGTMVTILKTEIASLKTEISDLRNLKTQIASMDPKLELASIETKIEKKLGESTKEQEKIKADLAGVVADMEAIKSAKKKGK